LDGLAEFRLEPYKPGFDYFYPLEWALAHSVNSSHKRL